MADLRPIALRQHPPPLEPPLRDVSQCIRITGANRSFSDSSDENERGRSWRALFVVHSSTTDPALMRAHARVLALSASSWLVRGSDLVYAYNGADDLRSLRENLRQYPQATGGGGTAWLCPLHINYGYWCGQFADWHRVSSLWRAYDAVVYFEDDVFLTPLAVRTLSRALLLGTREDGSASDIGRRRRWYVSRHRDGLALEKTARQYSMDLVMHTVEALQGATVTSPWGEAYHSCADGAARNLRPSRTKGASPPGGAEGVLWQIVNASGWPVHVLLEQTFHGTRQMDAIGVWHTHNVSDVESWLDQQM